MWAHSVSERRRCAAFLYCNADYRRFAVLSLHLHAGFTHKRPLTRKRIGRELIPIITLSVALVTAFFIAPAAVVKVCIYLFLLFYLYLLIKYTRLFISAYRNGLRKLDNFFSGREAQRLRWIKISFFAALSVGVIALLSTLAPGMITGIVCSVFYFVFYLSFAISFVNHGFVYKKLEQALTEEEPEPEKPDEEEEKSRILPLMIFRNKSAQTRNISPFTSTEA